MWIKVQTTSCWYLQFLQSFLEMIVRFFQGFDLFIFNLFYRVECTKNVNHCCKCRLKSFNVESNFVRRHYYIHSIDDIFVDITS